MQAHIFVNDLDDDKIILCMRKTQHRVFLDLKPVIELSDYMTGVLVYEEHAPSNRFAGHYLRSPLAYLHLSRILEIGVLCENSVESILILDKLVVVLRRGRK